MRAISARRSTRGRRSSETYNPSADWRKWPFANVITETYPAYRAIVSGTDDVTAHALARLLPHGDHAARDGLLRPDSLLEGLDKNESLEVGIRHAAGGIHGDVRGAGRGDRDAWPELTLPSDALGRYDGVYAGNIAQWLKFANSLKLRMAMRLTYAEETTARAKAAEGDCRGRHHDECRQCADDAAENRTTLIYNDWGDHRVGADILCYMNGYNDPRREKMFLRRCGGGGRTGPGTPGSGSGLTLAGKATAVSAYSNMIISGRTPTCG